MNRGANQSGLNDTVNKPTLGPAQRDYGESAACYPSGPSVVLRGDLSESCSELQGMIKFKGIAVSGCAGETGSSPGK